MKARGTGEASARWNSGVSADLQSYSEPGGSGPECMGDRRDYSERLLDHYRNPRNVGDLENPDAVAMVGSPYHGDVVRLSLRIVEGTVVDARFKAFGCAAAIAASSMTTEMVRGRSLEEVERITNLQVAEALGGLPKRKIHCSILAEQALREALASYRCRAADGSSNAG